jgi:hypothetical protein
MLFIITEAATNPELGKWKDITAIIAVILTLITLIKGVFEYVIQGRQKRAEHFFNLRKKLKENETFKLICFQLETGDRAVSTISFADKRDFLGLFEEVAIMRNSGLINSNVAFYMFGYYALLCWNSDGFWADVNRNSIYWKIFAEFAKDAEIFQNNFASMNWKKIQI